MSLSGSASAQDLSEGREMSKGFLVRLCYISIKRAVLEVTLEICRDLRWSEALDLATLQSEAYESEEHAVGVIPKIMVPFRGLSCGAVLYPPTPARAGAASVKTHRVAHT